MKVVKHVRINAEPIVNGHGLSLLASLGAENESRESISSANERNRCLTPFPVPTPYRSLAPFAAIGSALAVPSADDSTAVRPPDATLNRTNQPIDLPCIVSVAP